MIYERKVRLLKSRAGRRAWRWWRRRRGDEMGFGHKLTELIQTHAPDKSWVDVGCMWGVNGSHLFLAEKSGAKPAKGVDVFGPTPEFEAMRDERNSEVEFVLGDVIDQATIEKVGVMDVVFCAGVLYHHPSPFDVLVALRRMCSETLLLRTATIPEIRGLPNAAVYWPMLDPRDRGLWNLKWLGKQVGIADGFEPQEGYGNWFWGLTPSCLQSMLETAGFRVLRRLTEPFAQTVVCQVATVPFAHRMPSEGGSRALPDCLSADSG